MNGAAKGGVGGSRTTLGCVGGGLAFHFGVLLALLLGWVAVGLPLGSYRLRTAEKAWSQSFLTDEQFGARYPRLEHSPTALRLDALARRLGTHLVVTPEDLQAKRTDRDEFKETRKLLADAHRAEQDGAIRIPPAVARFAEAHAGELAAMETELLGVALVEWKTMRSADDVTVAWLGIRNVESLLLVRSLLANERGVIATRDRALEASWRLGESLWGRTDVVDKMIAIGAAQDRNACLRHYASIDSAWRGRLLGAKLMLSLADVYQADGQTFCRSARRLMGVRDLDYLSGAELPAVGWRGWLFRVVTAPYVRISTAGYSEALRLETQRLRELDPCTLEREAYRVEVKAAQPAWNVLSRVALPPLVGSWLAGRDAALDDEFTATVLEARGRAGSEAETQRPSAVCRGLTWVTTAAAGGRLHVEAQGGRVNGKDDRLPLRYSFPRR